MKKDVTILRAKELIDLLCDVEDQLEELDPMPTEEYLKGMRSGLSVAKKLVRFTQYEAIEYDNQRKEAEA